MIKLKIKIKKIIKLIKKNNMINKNKKIIVIYNHN